MCGRYLLRVDARSLERAFGVTELSETPRDLPPRFNIAPTQAVPIVRNKPGRDLTIIRRADGSAGRELVSVRWGLIPAWAEDPAIGDRTINARAEGVSDKPSFRAAFRSRRCVVPASGFYEWRRQGRGPKRPHLIRRKDATPLGFAGLWERWRDRAEGETRETFTIITTEPNSLMAPIHNRMPVIIPEEAYDRWLDPEETGDPDLLVPYPEEELTAYPISTWVNSPAHDDARCIEAVSASAP